MECRIVFLTRASSQRFAVLQGAWIIFFSLVAVLIATLFFRQRTLITYTVVLENHRYPGQEHVAGSPKIPTVMYYDRSGKMQSAGAETALPETTETAEEEEWLKVEWCVIPCLG